MQVKQVLIAVAALGLAGLPSAIFAGQQPSMSQGEIQQVQTTPSYKVELDIGPAAMMQMQGMGGGSGELMVAMPGMPMPAMATTDTGQPVNHHLEVHIYDGSTGAVVSNIMPSISITDSTGASRSLNGVMAMYDPTVGQSDFHFGNNVYLADGTYTITATVGQETAQFSQVAVSGGANLPPDASSSMGSSGSMGSSNSMGSSGSMGSMGSSGSMGSMGSMGSSGSMGSMGSTGSMGPMGR
jgi:hypothetical protein